VTAADLEFYRVDHRLQIVPSDALPNLVMATVKFEEVWQVSDGINVFFTIVAYGHKLYHAFELMPRNRNSDMRIGKEDAYLTCGNTFLFKMGSR
jgi:hypothetical protein